MLDNADTADFLFDPPATKQSGYHSTARLRIEYLPPCEHGQILITTRSRAVASKLADPHRIVNIQPTKQHAIALLQSKLS